MTMSIPHPDESSAATVVTAMTGETVISIERMATGDQNFVFAANTTESSYVIRMTDYKNKFIAAIYWQDKILPLGVPLAKFIHVDIDQQHSPYYSLLMKRLPGDDLINVYPVLSNETKRHLANDIVRIQSLLHTLPEATFYGYSDSYEHPTEDKNWYDFINNKLILFREIITQNGIFDPDLVTKVLSLAKNIEDDLSAIKATPFLWDASERNVMIYQDKIAGIVDVDEICFGDPLLVIGLTATALESEGYDTVYTDYWADALKLDAKAQHRLNFYRLFYVIAFMRKQAMQTANNKQANFDSARLISLYNSLNNKIINQK